MGWARTGDEQSVPRLHTSSRISCHGKWGVSGSNNNPIHILDTESADITVGPLSAKPLEPILSFFHLVASTSSRACVPEFVMHKFAATFAVAAG